MISIASSGSFAAASRSLALCCWMGFGASLAFGQVPVDDSTSIEELLEEGDVIGPEAVDAATLDTSRTGDILPGVDDELKDPALPVEAPPPPDTGRNFFGKIFRPGYPNPERAAALSLVLPGAGQIYNKRFWYIKVPVIYAGYVALIWTGQTNGNSYRTFRDHVRNRIDGPLNTGMPGVDNLTAAQLRLLRDEYDRRYQLAYIGLGLLHVVQTLEAYTTAHLLEFDMDESLSIYPTLVPPSPYDPAVGGRLALGMTVRLGR